MIDESLRYTLSGNEVIIKEQTSNEEYERRYEEMRENAEEGDPILAEAQDWAGGGSIHFEVVDRDFTFTYHWSWEQFRELTEIGYTQFQQKINTKFNI